MDPPDTPPGQPWIEVVHATPARQSLRRLAWRPQMTAFAAVREAALIPGIADDGSLALGIFGRRIAADRLLAPYERVEIYRALSNDPREARRRRVAAARRGPGPGARTAR